MGSGGASGGGGYGAAQKGRKASVPGTRVGFEGTYKSDINPNTDPKAEKKDNIVGGNGGGAIASTGQVVQAPKVISPTTAEVSQSAATDAEDPLYLRKKRTKAVGRSPTIMTGVTGVTEGLTLGKPSLLGR